MEILLDWYKYAVVFAPIGKPHKIPNKNAEAPKDSDGNKIASDRPIEPPVIKSITVETFGVDYGIPITLDVFDYYSWLMQQYYGYSH